MNWLVPLSKVSLGAKPKRTFGVQSRYVPFYLVLASFDSNHSCRSTVIPKIISALHRRFPKAFTPALIASLSAALLPPSRSALSAMAPEQREKEESTRISRQRPGLRVCAELALVGIIRDAPGRSGGEWVMKAVRELVSDICLCSLVGIRCVEDSS